MQRYRGAPWRKTQAVSAKGGGKENTQERRSILQSKTCEVLCPRFVQGHQISLDGKLSHSVEEGLIHTEENFPRSRRSLTRASVCVYLRG